MINLLNSVSAVVAKQIYLTCLIIIIHVVISKQDSMNNDYLTEMVDLHSQHSNQHLQVLQGN